MLTVVIGGSASGKSEYAEAHVCTLSGARIYLATMEPWDGECRARIARHQAARAHRHFATLERYRDLEHLTLPPDGTVLLECLSNLLANERYGTPSRQADQVLAGLIHLARQCRHLTIVTNEVFSGGTDYEGDTLAYLGQLAWLNRQLAQRADLVVEVVCGLPNVLKGARP